MDSTNNALRSSSLILRILFSALFGIVVAIVVSLFLSTPAEGINKKQEDAITQNCPAIKQTLRQLQKVDSRTRTYLGTTYEMVLSRFIVPLNLRLVKNNRPTLPDIQSDFTAAQNDFRFHYTEYMRELETLIAIDCFTSPEEFYGRLEIVREKRAELRKTTESLSSLAEALYQKVTTLKDSL